MRITNVSEAKAQLSALLEQVERGEEVIIARSGKPVARLVRYVPRAQDRTPGALRGRIQMADDFDELPADLAAAFGMTE